MIWETIVTLKAYYYATKKRKYLQILGLEFPVSGKREARAIALELGAKPWNF